MNEKSLQKLIERIRKSKSRDELSSAVQAALKQCLRQPGDQQLLASLLAQAQSITNPLPAGAYDQQPPEIRQAAVRCAVLLDSVKGRNPDTSWFKDRRVRIVAAAAAAVIIFYLVLLI